MLRLDVRCTLVLLLAIYVPVTSGGRGDEDSGEIGLEPTPQIPDTTEPDPCSCSVFPKVIQAFAFDRQLNCTSKNASCATVANVELQTRWANAISTRYRFEISIDKSCYECFPEENVLRYRFNLTKEVNATSDEILQDYLRQPKHSKLEDMFVGNPVPYVNHCKPNMSCGDNAACSTILNETKCRCYTGFMGDPSIKCFAFCKAETRDNFYFPQTWAGSVAYSTQKCPRGFSQASIVCVPPTPHSAARFEGDYLRKIDCNTDLNNVISRALDNATTQTEFDESLDKLKTLTANPSTLSRKEISDVENFIEDVTRRVVSNQLLMSLDSSFLSFATIMSQLSGGAIFPNSTTTEMDPIPTSHIVNSLPEVTLRSRFSGTETTFSLETKAFSLMTAEIGRKNIEYSVVIRQGNQGIPTTPVSVFIPASVIALSINQSAQAKANQHKQFIPTSVTALSINQSAQAKARNQSSETQRTAIIYYKENALFPSPETVSNVVSINVGINTSLDNLEEPVLIRYLNVNTTYGSSPIPGTHLMLNQSTLQCVYWDVVEERWSSEGCCLNRSAYPPECQCRHLTNFALIVKSENVPANFVLSVVSLVGCILSICGLIFTILVLSCQRDLRKYRSGKILLHLCCNLCVAYIVFASGVSSAVGMKAACVAVTALLHYFFLVSWCWMSVYSYEMYKSLVKVFSEYEGGFMKRSSAFSYFSPLLVVAITIGITVGRTMEVTTPGFCGEIKQYVTYTYHAATVCWLTGNPLYLGFLLPIGILLAYNFGVFILVTLELRRQNRHLEHLKRSTKDSLLIAITMTFIMGLTWLFGFLILFTTDEVFYTVAGWLFAVFNTLQGFGIFLLTTVRREDMRRVWWHPMKKTLTQDARQPKYSLKSPSISTATRSTPANHSVGKA